MLRFVEPAAGAERRPQVRGLRCDVDVISELLEELAARGERLRGRLVVLAQDGDVSGDGSEGGRCLGDPPEL